MTTGSWFSGVWSAAPSPPGGMIGHYQQKSWNGTNDPPFPPQPRQPPVYIYRAYYAKTDQVKKIRIRNAPRTRRSRKHVDPHNYSMNARTQEDRLFQHTISGIPVASNTSAFRAPTWAASTILDANDQLALLGKLKEKIQGSDFNLGIFLAEGNETLHMIADTAHRIDKSIRALRHGNVAGAARTLLEGTGRKPLRPYSSMKDLSNRSEKAFYSHWLELQYGWLPLLSDVESGAQFLAHKVLDLPVMRTSVSRRKEIPIAWVYEYDSVPGEKKSIASSGAKSHFRRLTVYHKAQAPSLAQQLGLLDPLSVAWEKLPWSFVVDWFIPIGQWLNANGFDPGVGNTCVTLDKKQGFQAFVDGTVGGEMPYIDTSVVRTVGPFQVPTPVFKGLGRAASWKHCANAIALLGQVFRK